MLTEFTQVESAGQIATFFYAFAFGCVACLVYDLLYTTRDLFRHNICYISVIDILYFLLLSVCVYCFLLVRCGGHIRFFPGLAMALGFIAIKISVSKWIRLILTKLLRWIRKAIGWIFEPVIKLFRMICTQCRSLICALLHGLKNIFKRRKKPLANDIDVDV